MRSTRRVERAAGSLATAAVGRMGEELEWFRALSAEHRSWVGLVAQAGIAAFTDWLKRPRGATTGTVFTAAPRELARVVSLQQAVELVRLTVDTVEAAIDELAAPGEEAALRLEVLRFSREIAFEAARVYASAAEERGAWHARQQALLMDALVRGEPEEQLRERAGALGWLAPRQVVPVVGAAPAGDPDRVVLDAERAAGGEALAGVHGDRLVVLVAAADAPEGLLAAFGKGAVVVGPAAPDVATSGESLAAALAAYRVAPAWPDAPRPVDADALLPERAVDGDPIARAVLLEVYDNLANGAGLDTVSAFLATGCSVEATARAMYLHPNTVRYRLRKASEVTGLLPSEPREAFALNVALVLGRLATP